MTGRLRRGWTLCVGAGVSRSSLAPERGGRDAFPDWNTLVGLLEQENPVGGDVAPPALGNQASPAERAAREFGPNAMIQAAWNRLNVPAGEFVHRLSVALYGPLQRALEPGEWLTVVKALSGKAPGDRSRQDWAAFLDIIRARFPGLTALSLAEAIVDADLEEETPAPASILSFNAEPLLFALINAFYVSKAPARADAGPREPAGQLARLDSVVGAITHREPGRIPYYYCHGLLPVEGVNRGALSRGAPEKLVFSESEYLQLANTSFSWQSATFISACLSSTIVFAGVSFTDPNLRRWLSWVHANRQGELAIRSKPNVDSTPHLWLRKAPPSLEEREWVEASVAHLGVRLVWLDEWSEMGPHLRAMLGLG